MLLHLLAAAGLLALLTIVPGPDMAVVTRRAMVGGRPDGFRAAAGVVAGLMVWGSLAVVGLTALLAASPTAYVLMKILGVAYLVFLGAQAFRSAGCHTSSARSTTAPGRPFVTGLTVNLLNPKIAVFYSALLPTLAPPSMDAPWGLAMLVLIHVALTLGWLIGYAYALTRARTLFEKRRVRSALDRITGVVLIGFAVRLATDHA